MVSTAYPCCAVNIYHGDGRPFCSEVEPIVTAQVQAERDRLLARIEALSDGFHVHAQASQSLAYRDAWQSATRQLRALVAEERAR